MKRSDIVPTKHELEDSFTKNIAGRNQLLSNLIRLLNAIEDNYVISIDGEWGSGKTFFVLQLIHLLKTTDCPDNRNLSNADLDCFRKKYEYVYYNAWEHDDHVDPLSSIIEHILAFYSGVGVGCLAAKKKIVSAAKALLTECVSSFVRAHTGGFVAVEKMIEKLSEGTLDDYIKTIKEIENKKDLLNKLIDAILPDGKRLLLVIDDLDRCRPDYAIKLLEVVKHFYDNASITVVIVTNNKQLAKSVEHVYGNKTDGYRYLNRIYDTTIYLKAEIDKNYLESCHGLLKSNLALEHLFLEICAYHNFTYRDCNRFVTMYKIIKNYTNIRNYFMNETKSLFLSSILIYALSLKIVDAISFEEFISGKGRSEFERFLKFLVTRNEEGMFGWIYNLVSQDEVLNTIDDKIALILDKYDSIFADENEFKSVFDFKEAVSLLGVLANYSDN